MRYTRRLTAAVLTIATLTTLGAATGTPATATPTDRRPAPVSTVTPVDNSLWPLVNVTDQYYMREVIALVAPLVGDDNADGVIREEESGWRCDLHGNKRCGKRALMAVKACASARALIDGRIVRLTTVPVSLMPACIKLGERKARTVKNPDGSRYTTPAGPALVTECRAQRLNRVELGYCLRQS